MPPKRIRKPTEKVAKPSSTTTRSVPAKKRANKKRTLPSPSSRSPSSLSALEVFSPPSTQSTAQIPPPAVYFVEYSIFFEHIELKKDTKFGKDLEMFNFRVYQIINLDLVQDHARKKEFAIYLYQNKVSIKPLKRKRDF